MEPDQQLRNLKDFLLVYNRMTEICFQRCTSNFNYRNLTMDEERCVDSCAGKLIRSNHRLMGTYVQLMPRMVQRRMEEMESKAAENAKAAEAAMSGPVEPAATEGLPAAPTPITPSPSPQVPPLLSPAATDVGSVQTPAAHGQATDKLVVSTPSPGLGEAIVRPQVHGSGLDAAAATLLPAAIETVNLNQAANGPSYTAVLPQTPIAGAQIESGSSVPISVQPVFTPSKPVTISEDVAGSKIGGSTVSKAIKGPTGQERAPEVSPLSGQK